MLRIVFLIALTATLSACGNASWDNGKINFGINLDEDGNVTIGIEGSANVNSEPTATESTPGETSKAENEITAKVSLNEEQEKVLALIAVAARQHNVDPQTLAAVGWVESRLRNVKNPRSSASGVMQFINSTAKAYDLDDPFDIASNVDAGARLMRDNAETLRKMLGFEPEPWHLYLAHQQGAGGAVDLLLTNAELAKDVVGTAEVALNTRNGGDVSTTEFLKEWEASFDNALAFFEAS